MHFALFLFVKETNNSLLSYNIVFLSWNIGNYWITKNGENCPVDYVVLDKPSCRDAAVGLGQPFYDEYVNDSKWPAGCSAYRYTGTTVFFNRKTDPSTTPISSSAGICRSVLGMVVNHLLIPKLNF